MKTLGGSIFVRNAIEFDYCIAESIASLCAVCHKVVVVDAESDDGTLSILGELRQKHRNLAVVANANWECAKDHQRLSRLANRAKDYLNTDWHFMLQADEVIHESSFEHIRAAVQQDKFHSGMVRRVNLFGDLNHCFRYDIPSKPCSDEIIRLATIQNKAFSDAESLRVDPRFLTRDTLDKITIFHYGFVRDDAAMLRKCRNMQSWFNGADSQVDPRLDGMSDVFDWRKFWPVDFLMKIPMEHPVFSRDYAQQRQRKKSIPVTL